MAARAITTQITFRTTPLVQSALSGVLLRFLFALYIPHHNVHTSGTFCLLYTTLASSSMAGRAFRSPLDLSILHYTTWPSWETIVLHLILPCTFNTKTISLRHEFSQWEQRPDDRHHILPRG